ncbi:Polyubiquitin [Glycine soja]
MPPTNMCDKVMLYNKAVGSRMKPPMSLCCCAMPVSISVKMGTRSSLTVRNAKRDRSRLEFYIDYISNKIAKPIPLASSNFRHLSQVNAAVGFASPSITTLAPQESSTMRVAIVTRTNQFFIEVGTQETVAAIKRKIEQILGIPVPSQILTVSGWELLDGLDMEDYPIVTEGTKIDLTIKPVEPHPSKMQITVKFSARKFNIEVDRTDTVRSLKEKIHIIDSTPIKRMTLYFSGRELDEDFRILSEYGIREFSEIVVFLKPLNRSREEPPTRKLSLVVQTSSSLLNGATIPLEMRDASTVSDLKQLLISRKILPVDDYLFIHKQRIMRDSCSLRWHGVEDGDCLYVFKGTVSRKLEDETTFYMTGNLVLLPCLLAVRNRRLQPDKNRRMDP